MMNLKLKYISLFMISLFAIFFISGCISQESTTKSGTKDQLQDTPTNEDNKDNASTYLPADKLSNTPETTPQQTPPSQTAKIQTTFTDDTFDSLIVDSDQYKGSLVDIRGKISTIPEISGNTIAFQMYHGGKLNLDKNILVGYQGTLSFKPKSDDCVRIKGSFQGKSTGQNAFGATLNIFTIIASSIEKLDCKDVIYHSKKTIYVQESKTINGITLTLQKIEFADEHTRAYLKVENNADGIIYFYNFNSVAFQDKKQFKTTSVYDVDFPGFHSQIYPNIEEEGVILFEPLDYSKPAAKFQFEVSPSSILNNYAFIFNVTIEYTPYVSDSYSVKTGDVVYLRFVQKFENGTIISTNYEDIAQKAGIIKDKYPPLIFTVGKGQVPKGLENAVIGMKLNEKKTITLQPKDAYGEYMKELVAVGDRIQYQDRNITAKIIEHLTSEAFKSAFGDNAAILGDKVSTGITPWNYTIIDIKDNNIIVMAIINKGQSYKLPDTLWNSTAIEVKDDKATFRQDPPDGFIVPTELGNATVTATGDKLKIIINPQIGDISMLGGIPARVTQFNETHITYDANQPLAGKIIIFDIELMQVTPEAT